MLFSVTGGAARGEASMVFADEKTNKEKVNSIQFFEQSQSDLLRDIVLVSPTAGDRPERHPVLHPFSEDFHTCVGRRINGVGNFRGNVLGAFPRFRYFCHRCPVRLLFRDGCDLAFSFWASASSFISYIPPHFKFIKGAWPASVVLG